MEISISIKENFVERIKKIDYREEEVKYDRNFLIKLMLLYFVVIFFFFVRYVCCYFF